jgi:hypothetical protein
MIDCIREVLHVDAEPDLFAALALALLAPAWASPTAPAWSTPAPRSAPPSSVRDEVGKVSADGTSGLVAALLACGTCAEGVPLGG